MVLSLTRPVASVAEPRREGTVVLAFDVSNSMAATDVTPSRLEAAKAAARSLRREAAVIRAHRGRRVRRVPALVTQRPTEDRAAVLAAIERLKPAGDTSLSGRHPRRAERDRRQAGQAARATRRRGRTRETPIGYHGGTAIVLLTDGENTIGHRARRARPSSRRRRECGSSRSGSGPRRGRRSRWTASASRPRSTSRPCRPIAATTGGTYRRASDAASLAAVYDAIELQWTTRTVPHEVTSWLAALGCCPAARRGHGVGPAAGAGDLT